MAASHSDSAVLATDATYQGRVEVSIIAAAIAISSEAITGLTGTTPLELHLKRGALAASVMNNPGSFKSLFANSVATDANVLSDATQAGTVVLTSGNVAAQAALVTDAHLDAAVSGQWNAFLTIP